MKKNHKRIRFHFLEHFEWGGLICREGSFDNLQSTSNRTEYIDFSQRLFGQ